MAGSGTELARTLRERRRALGLTRTRLAERSGIASVDLGKWERGEALPDSDQIVVLAAAVGLDDDETQAWLDAVVTVDITGPEVAVEIVDGDQPRANPFSRRMRPLRDDSSRMDRIRGKVDELRRNDPVGVARPAPTSKPAPPRPAPSVRTGLVTQPVSRTARELPSVFPDSQIGSYDPAVRVYSLAPSTFPDPDDEQLYLLRRIRTAIVLLGLGIVLWWSLGALGQGLGDVLDLFQAPVETSLIP